MIFFILTALALDAPMSPSEQVLVEQCLAEGATAGECACGLDLARERLTPRQMDLFAELAPMTADMPDVATADAEQVAEIMALTMERARDAGYTSDEIIEAMAVVFENMDAVEQACAGAGGAASPADEEIVEGLKDNAQEDAAR